MKDVSIKLKEKIVKILKIERKLTKEIMEDEIEYEIK